MLGAMTTPKRAALLCALTAEIARPYDGSADAAAAIDAALVATCTDQRDVLLVLGANWCP